MSNVQRAMRRGCARLAVFFIIVAFMTWSVAAADEPAPFDAEGMLKRAAAEFKNADRDADGLLTLEEFLASSVARNRDEPNQQFTAYNQSADGKLNRAEFIRLLSPTDERGDLRDPIVELEQAALAKWRSVFAAAGDGALTRSDWPAKQIARELPALADVTFDQWDKNHDGKVDDSEGRWLLGVAYGLTQLDGRPIRTTKGRVFSWYYFRAVDQNHDGFLGREEFVSQYYQGRERSAAVFASIDADQDGRLTAEETLTVLWHDTLSHFFLFDRDSDGYMTNDDFLGIGWGASVARRSVRAFDEDADGKISFAEFRNSTFANQASDWVRPRRDADNDGRLSWQEFYIEKPPLLIAQSRYFFDRFDLDKDGYLSYAEWEFDTSLDKVPPEVLFAARDIDGDGKLVLKEFFPEAKPPASDSSALDRYEMRLAAEENRFLQNDKDGNSSLDLAEFTESQRAAVEAARRQSKVLSDRKTMLEGNYYVRKGVLVVNEIAFLAIVWMVVRRTAGQGDKETQRDKGTRGQGDKEKDAGAVP